MDATIYQQLATITAFIRVLNNLEGQDSVLTLDAVEAMNGYVMSETPIDVTYFVRHYCDVIDGDSDAERIAGYVQDELITMPASIPAAYCPRCIRSGVGVCDDYPDCPAGGYARNESN